MPKKNLSLRIHAKEPTLERSLSNPELSPVVGRIKKSNTDQALDEQKGFQKKERKLSWFKRFFRRFDRKKRRVTEPVVSSESFHAIQKPVNCTFYAPPPKEFLQAATNREDETDNPPQTSCAVPHSQSGIKKAEINYGHSSQAELDPVVKELKATLSVNEKQEEIKREDDLPRYGNVSDLKYPASRRRKSRPPSNDPESLDQQLSEITELYEATWKYVPKEQIPNSPEFSKDVELNYDVHSSGVDPQPIKPLLAFPKPKLPINRKPSTRRGSKPEVCVRNPSTDGDWETSVQHRRSNAELEIVIQKLSDIPVPADLPTPKPSKRTKFFATSPHPPKDDIVHKNKISDLEVEALHVKEKDDSNNMKEDVNLQKGKLEKTNKQIDDEIDSDHNKVLHSTSKKYLSIKRTHSFPCIKFSFKSLQNKNVVIVETLKALKASSESNDCISQDTSEITDKSHFKRWNTMPPRYHRDAGKLPEAKENNTILVVNDDELVKNNFEDVPQLAILLHSDSRPITQDNSTQTSLQHGESILLNEMSSLKNNSIHILNGLGQDNLKQGIVKPRDKEIINQYTPPNTPEYDTDNDVSEDNASYFPTNLKDLSISHFKVGSANNIDTNVSTSAHSQQNVHEGLIQSESNAAVTLREHTNNKDFANQLDSKIEFGSHSKLFSEFKERHTEIKRNSIVDDTKKDTTNDVHSQRILLEDKVFEQIIKTEQKKPQPVKPKRIRVASTSQKPTILPKPQLNLKQEVLHQEKHLSSEISKNSNRSHASNALPMDKPKVQYRIFGDDEDIIKRNMQRPRSQSII